MKIFALSTASAMLTASVSCGGKGSSSEEHEHHGLVQDIDDNANVSSEDLPSSVTLLTESVSGIPVQLEYVPAAVTEQEAIAIARYLYGISTKDGEMMKSAMYDGMVNRVLSNGQNSDMQTYAEGSYSYYKEFVKEDYEFNYFIVGGLYQPMEFAYYDNIVLGADRDAEITGRKAVVMEIYYKSDGKSSGLLRNRMGDFVYLIVYTINGQSYVMESIAIDNDAE